MDVKKLKSIVISHGGTVVEKPELATHIIRWYDEIDTMPEELTEEFVRPLEVIWEKDMVRVHWMYYPDSYEEMISKEEVDVDVNETVNQIYGSTSNTQKQWNLCCRFITDCDLFNEWGNELDYETEQQTSEENQTMETPMKSKQSRRKSKKGVASPSSALINNDHMVGTESIMTDLRPPSGRLKVTSVTDITDDNFKLSRESNDVIDESTPNISDRTSRKRKLTGITVDEKLVKRSIDHSWFASDKISDFERENILIFRSNFHDIQNLEIQYMETRNQILDLSNQTPQTYFSMTDARRKVTGDTTLIYEIHTFLDTFGLINKQVDASMRPQKHIPKHYPFNANKSVPSIFLHPSSLPFGPRRSLLEFVLSLDFKKTPLEVTDSSLTDTVSSLVKTIGFQASKEIILNGLKVSNVSIP
jgi:hypothetical protein